MVTKSSSVSVWLFAVLLLDTSFVHTFTPFFFSVIVSLFGTPMVSFAPYNARPRSKENKHVQLSCDPLILHFCYIDQTMHIVIIYTNEAMEPWLWLYNAVKSNS